MLQVIIYGVGCGMSGGWWRNQHNKHHSMPQKLGHDVDLNTLPLVAFSSKVVKRIGIPMKMWLRLQAPMFPTITCQMVALGWQFYLHPRHILRTKNVYEVRMIDLYMCIFLCSSLILLFLTFPCLSTGYCSFRTIRCLDILYYATFRCLQFCPHVLDV